MLLILLPQFDVAARGLCFSWCVARVVVVVVVVVACVSIIVRVGFGVAIQWRNQLQQTVRPDGLLLSCCPLVAAFAAATCLAPVAIS